jgi:hypothetical protein
MSFNGAIDTDGYIAARAQVATDREEADALCEPLAGHSREICRVESEGRAATRLAELEATYRGTHDAARVAQRARIEARYNLARARCAPLGGYARDQCLVAAHALKGRALLEAQVPYEARRAS